uniref:Exopolygalacturonase-like n=1 Tax=Momordica charantia TaxID=3673 RepID=A0A6J1E198_MOMCH
MGLGSRSKFVLLQLVLLLQLAFLGKAKTGGAAAAGGGGGVLDLTKLGAKPKGDITQAFTSAWTQACGSTAATKISIPKGEYNLGEVNVKGPCKSPIEIELQGTLKAPIVTKTDGWLTIGNVNYLTLSGSGVYDAQGKESWKLNDCHVNKKCTMLPISFRFNFVNHSIVKGITSLNSKNFHVNVMGCNNVTFDHFTITAPEDSPNTDGIHIGRSTGINIISSNIGTGDDCVSIGDTSKQITVTDVTCGPGHGISIGSLGKFEGEENVEGVTVKKCKLINTSNGVRIKTWPGTPGTGSVTDMHFEDIEMVNVSNPVYIDQEYCPHNHCKKTSPSKIKISKVTIKNIKGTSATPVAVKLVCSQSHPCEGVEVADIDLTYNGKEGPIMSECLNVKPTISGKQNPRACAKPAAANSPSTP